MNIETVTAAGGVVYRKEKDSHLVLMIFRRGVWDLPKGKVEKGESIRECAVREVAEEVGLQTLPAISHRLTETYHEYEQNGIRFGKTTHWFAMRLNSIPEKGFNPQTEEGIEDVRWVITSSAKPLVGYDNLVDVLRSFEKLVGASR